MRAATSDEIFAAVETQRAELLNLIGVMQCMAAAVRHDPPQELEGAVTLVEERLQAVVDALERPSIERQAREGST